MLSVGVNVSVNTICVQSFLGMEVLLFCEDNRYRFWGILKGCHFATFAGTSSVFYCVCGTGGHLRNTANGVLSAWLDFVLLGEITFCHHLWQEQKDRHFNQKWGGLESKI